MGYYVFISYSHKDSPFILKLAEYLRNFRISIWIDNRNLDGGQIWNEEIKKALQECNYFLIALSAYSEKSEEVKKELDAALSSGRAIVPIMIEDCNIPVEIGSLQCIDFKKRDLNDSVAINSLLRALDLIKNPDDRPFQIDRPPRDFTGRRIEIEQMLSQFERGITISGFHGMGGVGKTALAYVLAERLRDNYPDGQILVKMEGTGQNPLDSIAAMEKIIHAYEPMASLPGNDGEITGRFERLMREKRALILLDNAKNSEQVKPLLDKLPGTCALIITSRYIFTLPGMKRKDLNVLKPEEATEFLLRICGYDLADSNFAEKEEICREIARICGNLPLALRAAGSLLATNQDTSPFQYLEKLKDERTRLKEIGIVGVDAGIEASFGLSYDLLPAETARIFRMLSIFHFDFDGEAEAEICQDEGHKHLSELLKWSLVEYQENTKRYRLHDLVRIFAENKLKSSDKATSIFRMQLRYSLYYENVLFNANELYLKSGRNGIELFERERENIIAGQRWAEVNIDSDDLARKLCRSYPDSGLHVLDLRIHPKMKISWLKCSLSACQIQCDRQGEGVNLGNLGIAYKNLGDARHAIEYYEQALAIAREIGDRRGEGNALGNLGNAYAALGDARHAIEYYEQHLVIAREIGDQRGEGANLCNLGLAYAALGDARHAIEYSEQALAIAREIGDRRGEGADLGNLGNAYAALGDARKAIEYYEQALAILREIGDRRGEGNALGNLGSAYYALGDARQAIEYHEQALIIAREIGDRRGEGNALGNLGLAYAALGDARRAIEYYEQALAILREIGDRKNEGAWLGNLGSVYKNLGDALHAIEYYEQHLVIAREIGDRRGEGNALGNLGSAYYALGDALHAIEYSEQALAIAREIGDRKNEGAWLGNLGSVYKNLGDALHAIEYSEQALAIAREIGDRKNEGVWLGNLGSAFYGLDDIDKSQDYYQQRLNIAQEIGDRNGEANALWGQAICLQKKNDPAQAIAKAKSALMIFEQIESPSASTMRKLLAEWKK
ncbi:MAG: tetratricopeptide repeat protein [Methanothrix sp.]|nr:tetratricopeptide repeat protein [Methanothrix sp.]